MTATREPTATILKMEDGKELKLYYDTNAFVELEEKFGIKTFDDFIKWLDVSKLSFSDLRALVWAGALHHHPDLTEKDVGRAGIGDTTAAFAIAAQAIKKSVPRVDDLPDPTKAKGKKGTR